jgi:pyroglutamyl-peptidase
MKSRRRSGWRRIEMAAVLITGFGPFPGAPVNPTRQIVRNLARTKRLAGHRLAAHVFATSYAAVDRDLPRLIAQHRPRALIMFGLAANTPHIRIETMAHNEITRAQADVTGKRPKDAAIRPARAMSRRGRASFAQLVSAARAAGFKAQISQDPGRYVCNYVYWRAIEAAQKPGGPTQVVFVHVPELRSGKNAGGLVGLHLLVRAAQRIVVSVINGLPAR